MSDLTDIHGCHVCGFMKCTCLDKNDRLRDEQLTAIREACVRANPEIADFRTIGFRFKFNERIFDFDGDETDRANRPWLTKPVMVLVSPRGLRGDSPWQTSDIRNMDYIFRIEETGEVLKCSFVERQEDFRECIDPIGRVIRLADVLLAIDKAEKPGELYAMTSSGIFIERELKTITPRILDGRMLSTGAGWDLHHDSLDEQSDECVSFLYDLLVA